MNFSFVVYLIELLWKIKNPKTIFFQGNYLFFDNLGLDKHFKNSIEDSHKKIYSRYSDSVSHKIAFTAYGLPRDQLRAGELIILKNIKCD